MLLIERIGRKLEKKLSLILDENVKLNLLPITDKRFGDYYSPFLFKKKIPLKEREKLAEKIIKAIENDKSLSSIFGKVEFKSPGFLNFFLSKKILFSELKKIISGKINFKKKKDKIIIEFISANPTGPLTFANARGGFLGDSLRKVLKKTGYSVYAEYFINDAEFSKQIKELGKTAIGEGTSYLTPKIKNYIKRIPKSKLKDEITAGKALAKVIQKENEDFIKKILKINFDNWFSEDSLYKSKEVKKILLLLKRKKLIYQKNKAWFVKTSKFGDNEDRVIIRQEGTPTYFLSDIAYHINKYKRGFNWAINIWGADHQSHIKRMEAVLKALKILPRKKFKVLTVQIVALKEGGFVKKMSKRKGQYLELKELVKIVGLDVARFLVLSKSSDTHFVFDLDLALEKSKKNPVYYLQYSWVRLQNIFNKTGKINRDFNLFKHLKNDCEINLLRVIIDYYSLLDQVASDFSVYKIAHYILEASKIFNQFYENCPVIKEKKDIRQARLLLLKGFEAVLKDSLDILGISLPKKM